MARIRTQVLFHSLVFFLFTVFSILLNSPSFAQEVDTNDSPVKGRLPDSMTLGIDRAGYYHSRYPVNAESFTLHFCVESGSGPSYSCINPDRKLKMRGKRQKTGVTISPAIEGEWRWTSDYYLSFKPKKPWPTGQSYTVTVDPHIYSPEIFIQNPTTSFSTKDLSVSFPSMTYFQDPSDVEKKGVTAEVQFNSPINEKSLKEHLSVIMEELSEESSPGKRKVIAAPEPMKFELTLNPAKTRATVSIAVKNLAEKERFMKLMVKQGVESISGGAPLPWAKPGELEQRVLLPSVTSYAKISSVQANIVKNQQFEPEQVIAIETNVPMSLEELKKQLVVKLLPKDKPAKESNELPKKDYRWNSAAEVTDEILKEAPKVEYVLNPIENDKATLYSAKFKADPSRWVYVRVSKGLKCRGGYILGEDYNTTLRAPEYGEEAKIITEGALLSLSGEKKVSVYALGVDSLEFEVGKVIVADINHLISQTTGSLGKPSFQNWSFNEEQTLQQLPPNKPQFTSFDFTKYIAAKAGDKADTRGLFFLNIKGKKKNEKGQSSVVSEDKRFILITDVGFYVKTARDGSSEVFAQSLKAGTPVANAKVEVLGLNGIAVFNTTTDTNGHAAIPNLQSLAREKAPVAYVLTSGDDLSFLPYQRSEQKLDYSRFETGGTEALDEGLRGFLFSDRGIYRPGDSVHMGMIVKQGDWGKTLEGMPLFITVDNPRGIQIEKKLVKLNTQGFIDYSFQTKDTSPTGAYSVSLALSQNDEVSTQIASSNVRVEEFLPDTMKITAAFNKGQPKGWLTPESLKADVTLMHLYGAPAIDHKIKGSINVNPGSFSFGGEFEDFSFFDPKQTEHNYDQELGTQNTDEQGKSSFDINLASFGDSTYRLTFYAEGSAPDSGRSVRTARTALVSSLPYVVGMKAEGNLNYINKGTERAVQFVAVDPELNKVAASGLTAELSKITYISTLVKNGYGSYAYKSIPQESKVSTSTINIPAEGLRYPLEASTPGEYVLTLLDSKGLKRGKVSYTIVGAANLLGHERKEATISVKLNKPKYEPGESVELSVVSPYTGTGLVTIETDKVLSHQWFKTDTESSIQHIQIPADFTGKGYLNVQFVRSLASKQVFTDPLAFTVVPLYVNTDSRDSKIEIKVPDLVQPGEVLAMKFKTKEPGKITLYAVDEGILQYGRYVTPDPLSDFLNNRALQVQTHQIFDLLMPEYSLLQQIAASGGDAALADGKNLNPFKRKTLPPVAFWSGVIDSDTAEHEVFYNVPDYFNGTIRVMAVAVTKSSIGHAESKVPVRGDLIVSPNAPTFVAPGDEFQVGVQVANNIVNSGAQAQVEFVAEPSEHLEVLSEKTQTITVAEGKETSVKVKLLAKDRPGGASVTFRVKSGRSEAKYEATLSVRPPVQSMTVLNSGYVEKGDKTVAQGRKIYKEFSEISATASTLPVSLVPGLQDYLDKYPYGCTEQLVSKAFPSVVLYGEKELQTKDKEISGVLSSVLSQIRERQLSDGGLGLWWSGYRANDFVTIYALHFLVLAKEKHLPVPNDLIEKLSGYVRNLVNQSVSELWEARQHAYGIYVLTRNGMVTTNYIPYVVQYLEENHKGEWKKDIAAVYIASSYKLLQLTPEANALMKEFIVGEPAYWKANSRWYVDRDDVFYNSLNRYSLFMSLMSEHFPEMLKDFDRNILFRVSNFIGEGSYNTTSSSYAVLGLVNYAKASSKMIENSVTISQKIGQGAFTPAEIIGKILKRTTLTPDVSEIQFGGGGTQGLFYQISTTGFDRELPKNVVEQGLEISRTFLDKQGKVVKEVKVGDQIDVVIKMRSHGDEERKSMVVVDLLPGGFEVVPDTSKKPSASEGEGDSESEGEGEEASEGETDDSATPEEGEEENADVEGTNWSPDATDVREDRVIAFGAIPTQDTIYRYTIKAVNAGSFVIPPAFAESMYDPTVKARGVSDHFTVTAE